MKLNKLYLPLFAAAILLSACSKDDETVPEMVYPSDHGTFVDERDGNEYHWVRYGNLDWMAENARYYIDNDAYCVVYSPSAGEGSTDYSDHSLLPEYGCLYNMEGATQACPDGWRLPTDEEWQQLEQQFGMSASQANSYEWRGMVAQNMLKKSDDFSTLHLQLGGYYTKTWVYTSSRMREWSVCAYYWTSTKDPSKENNLFFYRRLMWNKNEIYRQSTSGEDLMFSVRYVREAK